MRHIVTYQTVNSPLTIVQFRALPFGRRREENRRAGLFWYALKPQSRFTSLYVINLVNAGMSNTSDFLLKKEDHTLGNLLSDHLKMHPNVLMAGYKGMCLLSEISERTLC